MKYYDLNASSFAEKIQVGRSSISHILSGRNKPSLDFVLNIVNTFSEVDLYWLLNGTGEFPKTETNKTSTPNVTSTTLKSTSETLPIHKDIPSNEPEATLFSNRNASISQNITDDNKGKKVTKIIILYSDGTFKDYLPE